MPDRRDYLGDCNDQNVPLGDFKVMFCDRCHQPECSRSLFGTTLFDKRVSTWKERLFTEVPRMDPTDHRYLPIAGAGFKMFDPGQVPSSHAGKNQPAWLDPREVREPQVAVPVAISVETTPQESDPVLSSPPVAAQAASESEPIAAKKASLPGTIRGVANLPHQLLTMNAPSQSKTLPGASSVSKSDAWAAPVLAPEDNPPPAPVVKKGAKIKFGGGGVE